MREQIELKKQIGSVCHRQHIAAEFVAKLYRSLRKDEAYDAPRKGVVDCFGRPIALSQYYWDSTYKQIKGEASDLCRQTKKKMLLIRSAREAGIPENQIQY